jgi:leader peptidase (prepilin peptidase)/N-methyltransferase
VAANCAVIAEIDARLQIIPDPTVVALGVLAVIAAAPDEFLSLFVGATIAGGVFVAARQGYFLWRKREGLGLGDVKFALAMGALIGAQAALLATAAAAAITIVWLLAQARATPAEGVAVADFSLREAPFGVGLAAVTAIVFVLQTASWP